MKCEDCDCETYIIHMTKNHEKLCTDCFKEAENKKIKGHENSLPDKDRY